MGLFSTILPSSTVPSTYKDFPLDMDDWNCAQWKAYYQRNKTALGKEKALEIVNIDSERIGVFANVHSCIFDCDWINYFKSEGLKVSSIVSSVYCGAVKGGEVVGNAVDTAANVTDFASSFTGNKLLLFIGLGVAGYVAYNHYKN